MYKNIVDKKTKISVIGLGYVGLPIALEFAKKGPVIGYDIREDRIELMRKGIDPSNELGPEAFENTNIQFSSSPEIIAQAGFHIIAVPTPIDDYNLPDLKPLLSATAVVGKNMKKGDYVVYESTVYPGCTEEECIPLLEESSGLKYIQDFKVGFSPERINPGDKVHTLTNIVKVVSGCDKESLENISKTYEMIITAGVHRASSIKVAEAAKIIENTQRDINIAFMNELSIVFGRLGINTYEVLEAAGTKWNFLKFFPGLVGGHCIGVDPYYLTYKAKQIGYHAQIISSGRFVNDSMGGYVAKQTVKKIIANDKNIRDSKVLIMGATFKENVSDIRNSKVVDIVKELHSFGVNVDVTDPYADPEEVKEVYGFELKEKNGTNYDAVIVAVSHAEFIELDESYFIDLLNPAGLLVDIKGVYRGKMQKLDYWSL
ncbi:MAG: nucleotide sugar dehydrogenase [Bacteroidota bacterium]|nr:nucleotide sugar dehydrogenase [Bacteroidota bacterium]